MNLIQSYRSYYVVVTHLATYLFSLPLIVCISIYLNLFPIERLNQIIIWIFSGAIISEGLFWFSAIPLTKIFDEFYSDISLQKKITADRSSSFWNRLIQMPSYSAWIGGLQWILGGGVFFYQEYSHGDSNVAQWFYLATCILIGASIQSLLNYLLIESRGNAIVSSGILNDYLRSQDSLSFRKLSFSMPILVSLFFFVLFQSFLVLTFHLGEVTQQKSFVSQLNEVNQRNLSLLAPILKRAEWQAAKIANNPIVIEALKKGKYEPVLPILNEVLEDKFFFLEDVYLAINDFGWTVVGTGLSKNEAKGILLANFPQLRPNTDAARNRKSFVGQTAEPSFFSKKLVLFVSAPILGKEGAVIGMVALPIVVGDAIATSLSEVKIGKTGFSFLLDKNLAVIYHPIEKYLNMDLSGDAFAQIASSMEPEIPFEFRFEESVFVITKRKDPQTGFLFFSAIDKKELGEEPLVNLPLLLLFGYGGIFFLLFIVFWLFRNKFSNVIEVQNTLGAMEKGDLTLSLQAMSNDEFGILSRSLAVTSGKIQSVISSNREISVDLSSSSNQLVASLDHLSSNAQTQAASIEQISASIEEITAAVQNVDTQAESQFQKVDYLKKEMGELSQSTKVVGSQVARAAEEVRTIAQEAKVGQSSLDEMQSSISKIGESSQEIGSVIEIINNISEQINLLALNAAIEAARAGVYGRGFAVVADEIGKLAIKTADSIKDIGELIEANDQEILKGTEIIGRTVQMIQKIIKGVTSFESMTSVIQKSTDNQLKINQQVSEEVEGVNDISRSIRLSMEEQKAAINEVAEAIYNINDLTQSTASGLEEMTTTSNGIARASDSLKRQIQFFKWKG